MIERTKELYESCLSSTKEHQALRLKLGSTIPLSVQVQLKDRLTEAENKFVVRQGYKISVSALRQLGGLIPTKMMTDACFCALMGLLKNLNNEKVRLLQPTMGIRILDRQNPAPIDLQGTGVIILIPCKSIDHWYLVAVDKQQSQITILDPWCKSRYDDYVKETAAITWWADGFETGKEDMPWSYEITHPLQTMVLADVNVYVCFIIKRMMTKRNHEEQVPSSKDCRMCQVWELMFNRLVSVS